MSLSVEHTFVRTTGNHRQRVVLAFAERVNNNQELSSFIWGVVRIPCRVGYGLVWRALQASSAGFSEGVVASIAAVLSVRVSAI